jgi:hypothetical protein
MKSRIRLRKYSCLSRSSSRFSVTVSPLESEVADVAAMVPLFTVEVKVRLPGHTLQ